MDFKFFGEHFKTACGALVVHRAVVGNHWSKRMHFFCFCCQVPQSFDIVELWLTFSIANSYSCKGIAVVACLRTILEHFSIFFFSDRKRFSERFKCHWRWSNGLCFKRPEKGQLDMSEKGKLDSSEKFFELLSIDTKAAVSKNDDFDKWWWSWN